MSKKEIIDPHIILFRELYNGIFKHLCLSEYSESDIETGQLGTKARELIRYHLIEEAYAGGVISAGERETLLGEKESNDEQSLKTPKQKCGEDIVNEWLNKRKKLLNKKSPSD